MTKSHNPNRFPRSVFSVSREEFWGETDSPDKRAALKLNFTNDSKFKKLPPDIQGHVYIVGPVGSVDSPKVKVPDQTVEGIAPALEGIDPTFDGTVLLFNGDGMIYRLDFNKPNEGVKLSSRLVKPPCYYADLATQNIDEYKKYKYETVGITRIGPLGIRNQLNTALLAIKFPSEDRARLLVTWDVGRPYEIDPYTLETVTPVGSNFEWNEGSKMTDLLFQSPAPFPAIQSSAHPYFVIDNNECVGIDNNRSVGYVFTVNITRSLSNVFSQTIPWTNIVEYIENIFCKNKKKSRTPSLKNLLAFGKDVTNLLQFKSLDILIVILQVIRGIINFFIGDLVEIVQWDGSSELRKWKVYHNWRPIAISQSAHQIGVTEDYIIIIDTAFKMSIAELLPSLKRKRDSRVEKWIRKIFDHPQLADNRVFIISRQDLKEDKKIVHTRKLLIPLESAHFLVNYKNPNGKITIHFSHVCAFDAAETLSKFDYKEKVVDEDQKEENFSTCGNLPYGVMYSPVDISRLSYHVIDGETGKVYYKNILMDIDLTWGPAIYAYRFGCNYATTPEKLEDIYWLSFGCWEELLSSHILELYKNYKYREIGIEVMEQIIKQGRKNNLLHLKITYKDNGGKTDNQPDELSIVDSYQFPEGHIALSPQFIPSKSSSDQSAQNSFEQTDGYLVCLVQYGEITQPTEVWIFDAKNLKDGPLCKLSHPELNIGFTVHSTWLEEAKERTADYNIPIREDYEKIVDQQSSNDIKKLFEDYIYPQKEARKSDKVI